MARNRKNIALVETVNPTELALNDNAVPPAESAPVVSGSASEVTVTGLAAVEAEEKRLKALKAQVKEATENAAWEEKTLAKNPNYVPGSLRKATDADRAILSHCHGEVCEIRCESCGEVRVVNKQDAKQCRFCTDCKKTATKNAAKVKRAEKRLSGKSVEALQAEIAEAQKALEALQSKAS
jgi:hypothetical protein